MVYLQLIMVIPSRCGESYANFLHWSCLSLCLSVWASFPVFIVFFVIFLLIAYSSFSDNVFMLENTESVSNSCLEIMYKFLFR